MNSLMVYFSATKTTEKIVKAIGMGLGDSVTYVDITNMNKKQMIDTVGYDIIILASPIYGEQIPEMIFSKFQQLELKDKKLIGISVYGNIGYGISLLQYRKLAIQGGASLFALGACIGEHTYATKSLDIGYGRPDEKDLREAEQFGEKIRNKYQEGNLQMFSVEAPSSKLPQFISNFPDSGTRLIIRSPKADNEKCNRCGACSILCPAGAIDKDTLRIDESKCLRCYACVKRCPKLARTGGLKYAPMEKVFRLVGKKRKENLFIIDEYRKQPI